MNIAALFFSHATDSKFHFSLPYIAGFFWNNFPWVMFDSYVGQQKVIIKFVQLTNIIRATRVSHTLSIVMLSQNAILSAVLNDLSSLPVFHRWQNMVLKCVFNFGLSKEV